MPSDAQRYPEYLEAIHRRTVASRNLWRATAIVALIAAGYLAAFGLPRGLSSWGDAVLRWVVKRRAARPRAQRTKGPWPECPTVRFSPPCRGCRPRTPAGEEPNL
jgi:hypothetical protein